MLQIRIPPQVRLLQHLCRDKWHEWMYIPPVFRAGCLKLVLMVDVRSMCLYETLVGHVALSRQRYLTVAVLQVRHIFVAVGPGHGPIRGEILHETSREPLGRFAALQARMTGAEGAHEVKMLAIGAPCRDGRPHREDASFFTMAAVIARLEHDVAANTADPTHVLTRGRVRHRAKRAPRQILQREVERRERRERRREGKRGLLPGREVRGREDGELTPKYLCKYLPLARLHRPRAPTPRAVDRPHNLQARWTPGCPTSCPHDSTESCRKKRRRNNARLHGDSPRKRWEKITRTARHSLIKSPCLFFAALSFALARQ